MATCVHDLASKEIPMELGESQELQLFLPSPKFRIFCNNLSLTV